MKDEYVIINKTAIQKRIEELEKHYNEKANINDDQWCSIIAGQITGLKQILSQSTPLIPEIEKTQELLSDRRFTLEEVELIFGLGAANHANGKPSFEEVIQSLSQPKSWKVECIEENGKIKILRIL